MFKLKEFSSDSERAENLEKVVINFRSLVGEIPQIRLYEVMKGEVLSDSSYDVVIHATFDSFEDLRTYQSHPAHLEAVVNNRQWCDHKVVGDYIIKP